MLVSCFTTPSRDASEATQTPAAKASAVAVKDPFPAPKEGISIKVGPDGEMKLAALLNEFSRVTGNTLLINKETKQALENMSTGLNHSLDVPAQDVYPVIESILVQNDFVLVVRNDREPRLIAVENLNANRRGGLKMDAVYVPGDQIAQWTRHPAFLVTTMIDLPYTDVRTMSNSLRTMFTDQNTQQIIPVGNSNTLMMTGSGAFVANLSTMLRATDDVSRLAAEQAKKNPPVAKPPAPPEQPSKEAPTAEARPK
jgi:type II secretory pathway component GspD/PulD (secretin)